MAAGQKFSVWTFVAFIPSVLAVVLCILATASHNWIESFSERRTGVNSMGLWEICFESDFAAPWHVQDVLGKRYGGCNWILDYELRTLRSWLFTSMSSSHHILCIYLLGVQHGTQSLGFCQFLSLQFEVGDLFIFVHNFQYLQNDMNCVRLTNKI
jgi:hypothetical protein